MVKRFVFQYYIVVLFIALVIIGIWFYFSTQAREDILIVLTVLGGVFSLFYFVQQQQLEELKPFKELFNKFNARYEKLNNKLADIKERAQDDILTSEDRATLNDYFNLCGEEYFYYSKGYIYPQVWKAWCKGMLFYLEDKRITALWRAEQETDSHYGLDFEKIKRGSKSG